MKINRSVQLTTGILESPPLNATARPPKETVTQDKGGEGAFSVSISKTAGQRAKASELLANAPQEDQIRAEKIATIREQLASGDFNISGKDVASKLLNALIS